MVYDVRPIIVISKCLGFEPCRYNGGIEKNDFIDNLKQFVDFITVCPEVDSGFTIPRDTLKIVQLNDKLELVQPKTG